MTWFLRPSSHCRLYLKAKYRWIYCIVYRYLNQLRPLKGLIDRRYCIYCFYLTEKKMVSVLYKSKVNQFKKKSAFWKAVTSEVIPYSSNLGDRIALWCVCTYIDLSKVSYLIWVYLFVLRKLWVYIMHILRIYILNKLCVVETTLKYKLLEHEKNIYFVYCWVFE